MPALSAQDLVREWAALPDAASRQQFLQAYASLLTDEVVRLMQDAVGERRLYAPGEMQELAEGILDAAAITGRKLHEAWGFMSLGNAAMCTRRYEEAIAAYDTCQRLCLECGEPVQAARSQIGKVYVLACLGRHQEALSVADAARPVLEEHSAWLLAARMESNAAAVYHRLGDVEGALARKYHARDAFLRAGREGQVDLLYVELDIARVLSRLHRYDEALAAAERSRQNALALGHTDLVARADWYLAVIHFYLGQYNKALRVLEQARQGLEEQGAEQDSLHAELLSVDCLLALNHFAEALAACERLVPALRARGLAYDLACVLYQRAVAWRQLGAIGAASDGLAEAQELFEGQGVGDWVGLIDLEHARLRLALGAPDDALRYAETAYARFVQLHLSAERAQARMGIAQAHEQAGRADQAEAIYREALAEAQALGVPWLTYPAYRGLGSLAVGRGDREAAIRLYSICLDEIERLRHHVAVELRSQFLADKVEVYEALANLYLGAGRNEDALNTLERAKSRALVELMAPYVDLRLRARRPEDRPLVRELNALRRQHTWYHNALTYGARLASASEVGEDAPVATAEAYQKMRACEERMSELLTRLHIRHAAYAEEAELLGASGGGPPARLEEGARLVEYCTIGDELLAFVKEGDQTRVFRHLASRAEVARWVAQVHLSVGAAMSGPRAGQVAGRVLAANVKGQLARLYERLLAPPLEGVVGATRLVIVPHGALHFLPFHALHDGERYLVERHEVTYLPCASLLGRLAERRARKPPTPDLSPARGEGKALVVACSHGGRLPHVLEEGAAVADLLGGTLLSERRATRAQVRRQATRSPILHLAVHGEFRDDAPLFSGLHLGDGLLTAADVFNWRLPGSLVTLSACQTGRSTITTGDELVGLVRAWLYAGAAAVVVSLWPVDDEVTAVLMSQFYAALQSGMGTAAALRQAQCALLSAAEDGHDHPYFWAPFCLIGDWGEEGSRS